MLSSRGNSLYLQYMDGTARNFTRRVEDFTCGQCGYAVVGNGYTNHCPRCLYSRHVDIAPGDRAAPCQGLMEPTHVERFESGYKILHRCLRCGHMKKNQTAPEDSLDALLSIIERETKTNRH